MSQVSISRSYLTEVVQVLDSAGQVITVITARDQFFVNVPRDHATVAEALTAIGSNKADLSISAPVTLSSYTVIPDNVSLSVLHPGSIDQGANSLTINGRFEAPRSHIFTGTGSVAFSGSAVEAVYPEWWGAVGDGVTESGPAIVRAMSSVSGIGGWVQLGYGTYLVTANLSVQASIRGHGRSSVMKSIGLITVNVANTVLKDFKVLSSASYAMSSASTSNVTLERMEIEQDTTAIAGGATVGLQGYQTYRLRVLSCRLNFSGLEFSGCDDFLIEGNYWDCNYQNIDEPAHISRGSRGQYIGNTVYRSTSDCLDMYSNGGYSVIANNRFISPRLTGVNGAVMEVKLTISDNPANTSVYPGDMQNGAIITNNVFRDLQITSGSGWRTAISAFYLDSRSSPSFSQGFTAVGMNISNNTIEDCQTTESVEVRWVGIAFTGHNSIISNNVIRNFRSVNTTPQYGIVLSEANASGVSLGIKSTGVQVKNNLIAGLGSDVGVGIYAGNLEKCLIDGNIIRTDEWSSRTVKYGIYAAGGALFEKCSLSGNLLQCSVSTGYGLYAQTTGVKLDECKVNGNLIHDCGVYVPWFTRCQFSENQVNNATNSQGVTFGSASTSSRALILSGNQFVMSNDNCVILDNVNGFVAANNMFTDVFRPVYAFRVTKNGVVQGNISINQGTGASVLLFDGTVSGGDQTTTYVDSSSNKLIS